MKNFKQIIAKQISKIINIDEQELTSYIEIPKDTQNGDYAFPCFRLAKELRKAPQVIANEIKEKIELTDEIEKVEVAGGYLNFFINKSELAVEVLKEISNVEQYGKSELGKEKNIVIQYVDKHKLDEVSTSHSHQGVIAQVSEYKYWELDELIESVKAKNEDPFFIILDEITDPHNLGSIIRTADAVGAHGVIIPKRRSVHITPVVAKASAGAVEYVPVCKVTNIVNTIKKLKGEGLWIAAADMDGQTFYEQNLTGALGLVIGSEGFGISRLVKQNCDFTVKMPMIGNVTSLNASVAAGILLYEIFKQRSGNK